MKSQYIVTSTGIKNGNPYSSLSRIISGEKDNGDRYCFLDNNNTLREQEEMQIGILVTYETTRASASAKV